VRKDTKLWLIDLANIKNNSKAIEIIEHIEMLEDAGNELRRHLKGSVIASDNVVEYDIKQWERLT